MTTDNLNSFLLPLDAARQAHLASLELASKKGHDRDRALKAMAETLKRYANDVLEANTLDLEASREMAVPDLVLEWLKLTPERIQAAVQILNRLSELGDPIRRAMNASYHLEHSQIYSQLMPLGVIALVYEAFPQLGAIAAGLCIKSGNCLILKGGSESYHTNKAIVECLQAGLVQAGLPVECVQLLPADQGGSIRDLVTLEQYVNLVIPYGRPSLVQQVMRQATAPVLKSAMGNCYLYWSPTGSLDLARFVIFDSHQSEPDPVNAIEKVLIHRTQKPTSMSMLFNSLKEKGFVVKGDADLVADFPGLVEAKDGEWNQAYLTKTVAFKVVDSLEEGIGWINDYSSGHADCIVTESYQESRQFALGINSASTFINASPRFYRQPKQADTIFLGMSNQKGHRRGVIGLESLTTVKHIVQGNGVF
jgi:glutamate-5-semialdehyde dehydrogenase